MNKVWAGVSLIILIGWAAPGTDARRAGPSGPVRADKHAVADANGPFNALGATLFWGAWGYKFDRVRLERNLAVLSDAGIDYVRVLGSVGGASWRDREVDPGWPDYETVISGFTDLAFDKYGLRVQWTLFGGSPATRPGRARDGLVDTFAKMAIGREHKIFAFEIANESNGFEGSEGIEELRALGARLSKKTTILVALSDPAAGSECDTYAGIPIDAATFHYERGFGREGPWRPIQAPWDYPSGYDSECRGNLPDLVFNNEPIGPESSVRQDDDPARIAAAYVMTFLANHGAYVFHAGPGIRGGGTADVDGPLRRHADFADMPSFARIAASLAAARAYLPPGLANWTRHAPDGAHAPVHGPEHVYMAASGSDFVVLVPGAGKPIKMKARRNSSIEVRNAANGKIMKRMTLKAGQTFTLGRYEALVLIGRA